MHEPNYVDYSLAQLHDCLNHVNREKYPDRLALLEKEIALRTHRGETFSDPILDELIPVTIPFGLGFRAWWSFTWRIVLSGALLFFFLNILAWANVIFNLVPATAVFVIQAAIMILFILICGPLIMMQVLAKRYRGYRIRIVRLTD